LELHFKTTFNSAYVDTKNDQNRTWKIVSEYCCPPSVLLLYCVWRIISGLYIATKTLAFASYFCKMRVKILYW